jgi:hypothetical protein
MKIGGGFGSVLRLAASSVFSSESVLNLLVVGIGLPSYRVFCIFILLVIHASVSISVNFLPLIFRI